jgi:HlyD family secretion protein
VAADKRFFRALKTILTPAQRRRYFGLQAFFIFAGAVQVAGAGSIAPFVALLTNPSFFHTNAIASRVYAFAGFRNDTEALIAFAFAMMVALAASNMIAAAAVWTTFRFSLRLGAEIQRDIFVAYLYRDYVELTRTNSATLISNISQGATRFTYNVVQPLLVLTSQVAIVLVVIVVLTMYRPTIALSIALLIGGGYGLLFLFLRKQLVWHGDRAWGIHQEKQLLLTEGLGGLKEIRLAGSVTSYQERFDVAARAALHSDSMMGLLGDLPRFALETVAFCALLLLAVVLLRTTDNPSSIVAVLSLYAVTGYRMLPAAQSIFKSAALIRANAPTIHELLPDILAGREAAKLELELDNITPHAVSKIVVDDIWFQYPNTPEPVIRGLSVEILPNQLTVLAGPSGSGKSTLADLLLGLLRPDAGTITVEGKTLTEIGPSWQRGLGYVPQSIFLLDDTIAANIAFGSKGPVDYAKLERAAGLARLHKVIEALPGKYEFRVGERGSKLSGGQRQRLGIARALYHDAQLLVLDEATSALDGATELEFLDALMELRKEKTVLMIAHRMSTIQAADRILLLDNGRIEAVGTYDELIQSSATFRRMSVREPETVA